MRTVAEGAAYGAYENNQRQHDGEVLQSPREVNVMLDMIRQETGRIDCCLVELASGTSVSLGYKTAYNVPCRGLGRLETV